jgi:hypothetical protein
MPATEPSPPTQPQICIIAPLMQCIHDKVSVQVAVGAIKRTEGALKVASMYAHALVCTISQARAATTILYAGLGHGGKNPVEQSTRRA